MINEQLYINNILIPLSRSLDVALTKSLQDIKEPSKRKTTYSKSFTIPDSKVIRSLFDSIYEINLSNGTFNPLVKSNARIDVRGETIFEGYLQLKSIINTDLDTYDYEVVVYGELGNFFQDIKNKDLDDLNFSEYDHTLNPVIQSLSWDTSIIKNGVVTPFQLGEGYLYNLVDYGFSSDGVNFDDVDLAASLYVREIIKKIINGTGRTYTSLFLDSDYFRRLVIPTSPESYTLDTSEILDRQFTANTPILADNGTTTSLPIPELSLTTPNKIINVNELTDNGGNYDPVTGEFTCVNAGTYTFEFTARINATFTPIDLGIPLISVTDLIGYFELYKTSASTSLETKVASTRFILDMGDDDSALYTGARSTEVNPLISQKQYLEGKRWSRLPRGGDSGSDVGGIVEPRNFNPANEYSTVVFNLDMAVGDKIAPFWTAAVVTIPPSTFDPSPGKFSDGAGNYVDGSVVLNFISSSFYSKVDNTRLASSNTVKMNKVLPNNIKQTDFINSIVQAHNLFIEPDPNDPNNLIIETREDYFANSQIINIQDYIDRDKDITSKPTSDLNALSYIYEYKSDSDYFNTLYTDRQSEIYGSLEANVNGDFGKSEQKTTLIFSPTPLVSKPNSDFVLPTIQGRDDNDQATTTKSNIRLLYYGGMKATNTVWTLSGDDGGGLGQTLASNEYPYSGHFDDPYNPTLDINFGLVREVFYSSSPLNPITVTNNNLFNKYTSRMIKQFTDKSSRIVECYAWINSERWNDWNFKKDYYFNNAYHKLYKVFNFNPNSNKTTKCQFLKLADAPIFDPAFKVAEGNYEILEVSPPNEGEYTINEVTPVLPPTSTGSNGNGVFSVSGNVIGAGNYIAENVNGYNVLGDNNQIFTGAGNISLINSSGNTIESGVTGVTLINTTGITVTEDNTNYVGGVQVESATDHQTAYNKIESDQTVVIQDNKQMLVTMRLDIETGGSIELNENSEIIVDS